MTPEPAAATSQPEEMEHQEMNQHDIYVRGTDRVLSSEPQEPGSAVSEFAVHGDPSARREDVASPQQATRSVSWVRPSELATTLSAPVVRRAADLQAESTRRARRAPARITRSAIARTTTPPPAQERGLSL